MEIDDNVVIQHRAYARVGLFDNVIDVPYGKTISFSLGNFCATATLEPSRYLYIICPNTPGFVRFNSLQDLVDGLQTDGYDRGVTDCLDGGIPLIMALCKIFQIYCKDNNISLHEGNFLLYCESNIPPQIGLSSSSAFLCAALSCLLDFYKVRHLVNVEIRPNLIINAKKVFGIVSGLQGPAAQVYGGLVYMNFDKKEMEKLGHGTYTPMDTSLLPPLYLIYAMNRGYSRQVRTNFHQKFLSGDGFIGKDFGAVYVAEDGREALTEKDYDDFAYIMNHSFDLRRKMFGDDAIGDMTIKMIEIARSVGAAANFTCIGGAVVAYCPEGTEQANRLTGACKFAGFICELVEVTPPLLNEVDTKTMSYHMQLTWELCLQHEKMKKEYGENQVDVTGY